MIGNNWDGKKAKKAKKAKSFTFICVCPRMNLVEHSK